MSQLKEKINLKEIINEKSLFKILQQTNAPPINLVEKILAKAKEKNGLTIYEASCLLNTTDKNLIAEIFKTAGKIKNEIYGERLVFFAPLYISDCCINDCEYCNFHLRNKELKRNKLKNKEIKEQTKVIINSGHKRILLECGEDPVNNNIDYVIDAIKTIYSVKTKKGNIRRINVNIAATSTEDYRKLKSAKIGTYQLFQETYHQQTYKKLHKGPKADYERQITACNRAFAAGIDDLGLGVLFGLQPNWEFEVLALISHSQYLEKKFGVGPHTISVPRFQPAPTVTLKPKVKISDTDFLKLIAVLRLAVPYTGLILSTRENENLRNKSFKIGISQASAGSVTVTGGYGKIQESSNRPLGLLKNRNQKSEKNNYELGITNYELKSKNQNLKTKIQNPKFPQPQFEIQDKRSLPEVIKSILENKLLPSFCTACYRQGRTGDDFMKLSKPGEIHTFCRPNGLLTFAEYLEDFSKDNGSYKKGYEVINYYLQQIENPKLQKETKEKLKKIKQGERDLYF